MAKEIKSAEELQTILESRIRAINPHAGPSPLVVIVRKEDHNANWAATHSGQPKDIEAAMHREMPALQAQYQMNEPGREDEQTS